MQGSLLLSPEVAVVHLDHKELQEQVVTDRDG